MSHFRGAVQSSTTDHLGRVISYTYTTRNELASVSDNVGTESYAYDQNGNQTHRYMPNSLRTDQYYNPDGTAHNYYNWNGGSTVFSSYGYAYNADHQITGMNEGTTTNTDTNPGPTQITYGYDALGHLTSEGRTGTFPYAKSYTADGANNRTSMTLGGTVASLFYDADDELLQVGSPATSVYGYNANGDQTTATANAVTTTFGYDYDDQLKSITKPGSTTTYNYDALGRQTYRAVNGVWGQMFYEGDHVLLDLGSSGQTWSSYTWGNGLSRRDGEVPLTDAAGTTKLTTNGSQAVTGTQEQDAFGREVSTTGSTSIRFGFHGAEGYRNDGDGPAGLDPYQRVGARYYDRLTGRFITRDTDLSQSPYAYCDGDPVNFNDPTGHKKEGSGLV